MPSIAQIVERLELAGATPDAAWAPPDLCFRRAARSLPARSGIATHPALSALPAPIARALWRNFAERIEVYREADGIPLDFELAGVVVVAGR